MANDADALVHVVVGGDAVRLCNVLVHWVAERHHGHVHLGALRVWSEGEKGLGFKTGSSITQHAPIHQALMPDAWLIRVGATTIDQKHELKYASRVKAPAMTQYTLISDHRYDLPNC